MTANSNAAYNFQEIDGAANPGISHYVGDEIKFINNAGSTHPLFIVSKLNDDGGYSAENEVVGVQNQGATSGEVIVDLSTYPWNLLLYMWKSQSNAGYNNSLPEIFNLH